jgi:hypothetical protein
MSRIRFEFAALAWYGDEGDVDFVAIPPKRLERYTMAGVLHYSRDPETIDLRSLTMVDRDTGATVVINGRASQITGLRQDEDRRYVSRLWADALSLTAEVIRSGRPPGTTTIQSDDEIQRVVALLVASGRRVTKTAVAANSATFTYDQLDNYLGVNGKTMGEFERRAKEEKAAKITARAGGRSS